MVIFGAGASYDSDPSQPTSAIPGVRHRPPVTNTLFTARDEFRNALTEYVEFHAIVDALRNIPAGESLEQRLASYQAERDELPHRHRQLAAIRYYLQRILTECSYSWHI